MYTTSNILLLCFKVKQYSFVIQIGLVARSTLLKCLRWMLLFIETDKRNRNNILTKARNMKKEIVRGSYNRSMSTFPTLLAKRFYGVYFRIFWVSNKARELSNLPHMDALIKYHLCFLTKSNQSMHNSPYHFLFKPILPGYFLSCNSFQHFVFW